MPVETPISVRILQKAWYHSLNDSVYGNTLVVNEDENSLQAACLLLNAEARKVHTKKHPTHIPTFLKQADDDNILLDMNFAQDVSRGKEECRWPDKILALGL